jgi:hypothetical protein
MMKTLPRAGGYVSLLMLLLTFGVPTASASVTYQLGASQEIPAAQGTAKINTTRNGNVQIKLSVKHLAPPGRIMPGTETFVVWARGLEPGAEAQNLGALRVDKNLNGKVTMDTAMSSFDLFITCERTQTVTVPALPELLPLHYMKK